MRFAIVAATFVALAVAMPIKDVTECSGIAAQCLSAPDTTFDHHDITHHVHREQLWKRKSMSWYAKELASKGLQAIVNAPGKIKEKIKNAWRRPGPEIRPDSSKEWDKAMEWSKKEKPGDKKLRRRGTKHNSKAKVRGGDVDDGGYKLTGGKARERKKTVDTSQTRLRPWPKLVQAPA